jgi:hypothetical protein
MGKFFKWAWDFVPKGTKVWAVGIGITLALGLLVGVVYKIEKRGYDRCQAIHDKAEADHKEESRPKIVETEKKYEKIKNNINKKTGPNDIVGPRVKYAIDSMPSPVSR